MSDPTNVQVWILEIPAQHGTVVIEAEETVVIEERSTQVVLFNEGDSGGIPAATTTEHWPITDLAARTFTLAQAPAPSTLQVFWDSVLIWSGGLLPAWTDLDFTYDSGSKTFTAGAAMPLTLNDWLTFVYCAQP